MKIIALDQTSASDGELREPRGILTTVHVEPVPGVHVKVMLGSAGVFIRRGDAVAAFPIETLLAHAAQHAPDLTAVAPPPQSPR